MSKSFIECISVNKTYNSKRKTINAVTNINLQLEHDEFVIIKGRSGAGKSTLLHLIGGLITPTSGTIRIGENVINELNNYSLSKLILDQIGIIFQSLNLLPTYDVYENIEIAMTPKGYSNKEVKKIILNLSEQFQLEDKLHMLPSELSVGQQQKVAVIRTLAKQPSVILADEPTGSVDNETAKEILDYLSNLRKERKATVIVATHGYVPDIYADRIFTIENGYLKN